MLWPDAEMPEFCPIVHLLAYVYLTGTASGYLFPKREYLESPPDNGIIGEGMQIQYNAFQDRYKALCKKFVLRKGPFGTHSSRKTSYLFAVWGGGQESEMMQCARHKTVTNALKYKRDATFLLNIAMKNNASLKGTHLNSNHNLVRHCLHLATDLL
jgi:hypothetical protein